MDRSQRSRTSDIPAIMRAVHQTRDHDPKILVDPIAPMLVDIPDLEASWLAPLLDHPFSPQWRAGFLIRSRYAEDCLRDAVARGVTQYVILGAGLDTFSYRQPAWARGIRIFEVDHPATQSFKLERLAKSHIAMPANVTFVAVDFELHSLGQVLRDTGFASDRPAFCSWLGVTQYLTVVAIEATLAFVLSLPSTSEIVLSFILPQDALTGIEADAVKTAAEKASDANEPWLSRFEPTDLVSRLSRMGFSNVDHLTPEAAHERYLKGRLDGLAGRRGEQLIRAAV